MSRLDALHPLSSLVSGVSTLTLPGCLATGSAGMDGPAVVFSEPALAQAEPRGSETAAPGHWPVAGRAVRRRVGAARTVRPLGVNVDTQFGGLSLLRHVASGHPWTSSVVSERQWCHPNNEVGPGALLRE